MYELVGCDEFTYKNVIFTLLKIEYFLYISDHGTDNKVDARVLVPKSRSETNNVTSQEDLGKDGGGRET